MHKLYLAVFFVSIFLGSVFVGQSVGAVSQNVVISQVQVGGLYSESNPKAASQEFLSFFNNSNKDVDISNWCISNKTPTLFICFLPKAENEAFILPSYSYATISSENFSIQNEYKPDFIYQTVSIYGYLVGSGDTLKLIDVNGIEVDSVYWSSTLSGGIVYQRLPDPLTSEKLLETDNMSDFQKINILTIPSSGLEEFVTFDACLNLIGIQNEVPIGYEVDNVGVCTRPPVDLCKNIDDIQDVLPKNNLIDENGDCQTDICLNLDSLQLIIPDGMIVYENNCFIKPLQLRITELLPNAIGSDDGSEFIEIYNPNDVDVSLLNYVFYLSSDYAHFYSFPIGAHIEPGKFLSFSNDDINFTLTNVDGLAVKLMSLGQAIDETPIYEKPDDGMAWALIDGIWQYTNQPTPGGANLSSLIEAEIKVVAPVSVLVACKDGQYRSEETHRCRNIISDVAELTQCAEGQERNPATNRCRSIATAVLGDSTLKPCDPGQERNPDTNRCRNIVVAIPSADYAPEQVNVKNEDYTSWYIMGGLGLVAIGYGVWEWRVEFSRLLKKIFKIK